MLRLRALLLVAALALTGCTEVVENDPVENVASGSVPLFDQVLAWESCYQGFECTEVAVPIDWENPEGELLSIALMRAEGTAGLRPMLANPGGPGSSAIEWMLGSYESLGSEYLRKNFQVIAFDPRGVGNSSPVTCSNLGLKDQLLYGGSPYRFGTDEDIAYSANLAKKFGESCQGEISTGYFNTQQTANDMEFLRVITDSELLDFLGFSYGTELGATYAVLYPENVGLFVLDGAVDPTIDPDLALLGQIRGFDKALDAYLLDCFEQISCPLPRDLSEAKDTIAGILANLENGTLPTDYNRDLALSSAIAGIIVTLYSEDSWEYLSAGIEDALSGDGTMLLLLADFYNDRSSDDGYLTNLVEANYAIACADEKTYPLSEKDLTAEITDASQVFGKYFAYGESSCEGWPAGIGNQVLNFEVTPKTGPLIIGTTGDPATPYEQAVTLNSLIGGSNLLTYQGEGHTVYGSNACVGGIVDRYLSGEDLSGQDLNC